MSKAKWQGRNRRFGYGASVRSSSRSRSCGHLRAQFQRDGFAFSPGLISREAFVSAWEAVITAVKYGRYNANTDLPVRDLLSIVTLPVGLQKAENLNLIHNGFLVLGFRKLWPLLVSVASAARCILGLAPSASPAASDPDLGSVEGLRLSPHVRVGWKLGGREQGHIFAHQDAAYWAQKFYREEDLIAFSNATVSAWVPLVDIDYKSGPLVYRQRSHHVGFAGFGEWQKYGDFAEKRLVNPELRYFDDYLEKTAADVEDTLHFQPSPDFALIQAKRRDVAFHHMYTHHGPVRLPRNTSRVRWVLELRFHDASVVDRLKLKQALEPKESSGEKLTLGPRLDGVDTRSSFGTALQIASDWARTYQYVETRRETLAGSNWLRVGGLRMPDVGLGTGRMLPNDVGLAVANFLALGGRHIDTAAQYHNHAAVVAGSRAIGIAPENLVITTKVWPLGHQATLDTTLDALRDLDGIGQVVVLLHWPGVTKTGKPRGHGTMTPADCRLEGRPYDWRLCRVEAYLALLSLRDAGVIAGCGVSNFGLRHLQQLRGDLQAGPSFARSAWPIDVLQTEVHPWRQEHALLSFCKSEAIRVVAFASLGSPERKTATLGDATVRQIAQASQLTAAQVLLQWAVQQGLHVIPTTVDEEHMIEALAVGTDRTKLPPPAIDAINAFPQWTSRLYDPDPEEIE